MMNNLHWFKHDKNASFNDKLAELLNHEGCRGYGTYWYIIEMIYMQSQKKVNFNYLKAIERHGFTQYYMKKIITHYGLFVVEDDCFSPVIDYSIFDDRILKDESEVNKKKTNNEPATVDQPMTDKAATEGQLMIDKATTEGQLTIDKATTEGQPTIDKATTEGQPMIDKATTEDQLRIDKAASEDFSTVESSPKTLIISESEASPSLARVTRVRIDKNRIEQIRTDEEQIRLTSSSSSEKEKRKTNDDDDDDNFKKRKFQSWQELVEQLTPDSEWGEQVCMRCGYSILLKRHFKEAVNQFRKHIMAYDRGEQLCDLSEMRRYFSNYTAAGGRTSKELHSYLLKVDTQWQIEHPDPYRFEKIIDGRRTYMGQPIPDNAPPRPDDRAILNEQTMQWFSHKNTANR